VCLSRVRPEAMPTCRGFANPDEVASRNVQAGGGIKGVDRSHAPCVKPGRPHVITPSNSTSLMTRGAVRAQRIVAPPGR